MNAQPSSCDALHEPISLLAADGIHLDGKVACDWLTRITEAEAAKGAGTLGRL